MIKLIDETTYPIVVDWWRRHDFPVVPYSALPKQTGYVACVDDVPTAAGFLYIPRDSTAIVGFACWFVKNPASPPEDVDSAFDELNRTITETCKAENLQGCFTFTGNEALIHRLETHNYTAIESGQTMLNAWPMERH